MAAYRTPKRKQRSTLLHACQRHQKFIHFLPVSRSYTGESGGLHCNLAKNAFSNQRRAAQRLHMSSSSNCPSRHTGQIFKSHHANHARHHGSAWAARMSISMLATEAELQLLVLKASSQRKQRNEQVSEIATPGAWICQIEVFSSEPPTKWRACQMHQSDP